MPPSTIRSTHPRLSARQRNMRGATMVEASIAFLIIFALLAGVFQAAMVARADIAAQDGAAAGARTGAIAANDPMSDYRILKAISVSGSSLSSGQIDKVVIFKANQPTDPVPPACLTSPQGASSPTPCNVYTAADFSRPETDFGSVNWPGDMDWPASGRLASLSAGTDYIGVYVQDRCDCANGFSLPQLMSKTVVTQIEPTTP